MEAAVAASEKRLDKIEMVANADTAEAAVELQEHRKHLVVRRRRSAKDRIQESVGSRQKLFAARKQLIRRVISAQGRRNFRKGQGRRKSA
jgi:hypothetical protein